jgi:GT2 family glycosyltransferase
VSIVRATAIVVAYDAGQDLQRCVEALYASGYGALDVTVVDNASTDDACDRLEQSGVGAVRVVRMQRNLGFAGGVNAGVRWLESERALEPDHVLVLVNQDCIVKPGAVAALVARATSDSRIGIVGARILACDEKTVQHAGGMIRDNGLTEHLGRGLPDCALFWTERDVEYVTGALCAFRVETWRTLGPFDERYGPVYFEEVDFCARARRAGLRVVYEPGCVAVHQEARSSGGPASSLYLRRYHRNRIRFLAQHRLRRGSMLRTLAAEIRWLAAQRRLRDVWPALRAYTRLPFDLATTQRGGTPRSR